MARYRHIDASPRFLAVDLQRQLLPGTFEHAMNHLIDSELDSSGYGTFQNVQSCCCIASEPHCEILTLNQAIEGR